MSGVSVGKREDQAVALLCSVLAVKLWQHNHVLGERVDSWAIPTGLVRGKCSPQGGQRMAWGCIN